MKIKLAKIKMLTFFAKIIRRISYYFGKAQNLTRIVLLRLKYPSARIRTSNTIGKNCSIKCIDGSKLELENCNIGTGTIIHADHGGKIKIRNCFIGTNCVIVARESIEIMENCQIAEMAVIRDQNHNFGAPGKLIMEQGFNSMPIVIGANVWLGARVTVTAGSTIGDNTVVGANALVRGKLDANSVYGGVPARKIRSFG